MDPGQPSRLPGKVGRRWRIFADFTCIKFWGGLRTPSSCAFFRCYEENIWRKIFKKPQFCSDLWSISAISRIARKKGKDSFRAACWITCTRYGWILGNLEGYRTSPGNENDPGLAYGVKNSWQKCLFLLFLDRMIHSSFIINRFLFIRGLSCPCFVQASLSLNWLTLTIPGFPYNCLPVPCGNIGFKKKS